MKISRSFIRFLLEAGFLIAVAAVAGVVHLRPLAIVLVMAVAWALVALVERAATRGGTRRRFGFLFATPEAAEAVDEPEPAPAEPSPAPSHVAVLSPEPEPAAEPGPEAEPEPEPEVEPEPEPERIVALPQRPGAPREWNLWDLERLARSQEGEDAARDEELAILLMHLRQFADAGGILDVSFDPLVRESFGELLALPQR